MAANAHTTASGSRERTMVQARRLASHHRRPVGCGRPPVSVGGTTLGSITKFGNRYGGNKETTGTD